MQKTIEEKVEEFVGHFRAQINFIAGLRSDGSSTELYKQILYVCVLDTLSKAIYTNPKQTNCERFVSFVNKFAKWNDATRISLTHLVQLLKFNPNPDFENLRIYAASEFKKWPVLAGAIRNIDIDPDFNLIKSKLSIDKKLCTPTGNVSLESLQHCHLLYTYRNNLVHEFNKLGYGWELANNNDPHYHLLSKLNEYNELVPSSVELVYPTAFLHQLCKNSLDSFEDYMKRNGLNPYDYYIFGTYWIKELNE